MSDTEQVLLAAFTAQRDEQTFRAIYSHFCPPLFAMALRLTSSRTDAEDAVQEAWVRAVRLHDRFDASSRYGTWLVGILINCVREARRQEPPPAADASEVLDLSTPLPFGTAHDLEHALAKLAPGYRDVVVLHDVHGFTHKEIAGMLGIEEGSSKSQLARGRLRLRNLLNRQPEDSKWGENDDA